MSDKNIYDFIHPDDRARFNSNLLLMMPLGMQFFMFVIVNLNLSQINCTLTYCLVLPKNSLLNSKSMYFAMLTTCTLLKCVKKYLLCVSRYENFKRTKRLEF